ncbi:MAG TPA: hydroxymethylbilane synthase [Bacteriovoracaceae bacterium]|nr:hydroxymethylbilane synthase [Bacteriovoracaceae bacterium]
MTTYKLGTRGSLLAVTQSTLIKNQIEELTGSKVELVLIKTQGDQITNKPLWQLEGKDFFTKELDEALLKGEVDFVVHSYKDLGSERPAGIKLAAVTERKYAHDILLIRKDVLERLENWKEEFIVGTSSPRRIVNLTSKLAEYIPHSRKNQLKVKCETLRGNVNTRIQKLKDGNYHAITLALAGVERLAQGENSKAELRQLLDGLNYLILPQSVFPSAASQGALGLEIREDREDGGILHSHLSKLSHPRTVEEVYRERKAFKHYGGGCHLAVGIHVKKISEDNFLHVHAGEVDGKTINKRWLESSVIPVLKKPKLFVGLPKADDRYVHDKFLIKKPIQETLDLTHKHVFVTSRYCLDTLKASGSAAGLWAAGSKTAEALTSAGLWINGTSDSLGTEDLKGLKSSLALAMFNNINSSWTVLSHAGSQSDLGDVVASYVREEAVCSPEWIAELKQVGACYWTSFPQYHAYMKKFPFLAEAIHVCGLGKTWQEFVRAHIAVHPVSSMQEFYSLIKD